MLCSSCSWRNCFLSSLKFLFAFPIFYFSFQYFHQFIKIQYPTFPKFSENRSSKFDSTGLARQWANMSPCSGTDAFLKAKVETSSRDNKHPFTEFVCQTYWQHICKVLKPKKFFGYSSAAIWDLRRQSISLSALSAKGVLGYHMVVTNSSRERERGGGETERDFLLYLTSI